MKTIAIFIPLFFLLTKTSLCPEVSRNWVRDCEKRTKELYQVRLRKLYLSVLWVESQNYFLAYNEKENAGGGLQIRPVMIDEVNRLQDSIRFELRDRWNPEQSFKIFTIKMLAHNPGLDIVKACKLWNGTKTKKSYVEAITSYYHNPSINLRIYNCETR